MATQEYSVDLTRAEDGNTVDASVREFALTLGSKARDMSVGFNPVETLLSAAGACITSSLGLVANNSGIEIDDLRVHAVGTRQEDPPRLIKVTLKLSVGSAAPDQKIESVVRIATKSSTVVSTLREALDLSVEWSRTG